MNVDTITCSGLFYSTDDVLPSLTQDYGPSPFNIFMIVLKLPFDFTDI